MLECCPAFGEKAMHLSQHKGMGPRLCHAYGVHSCQYSIIATVELTFVHSRTAADHELCRGVRGLELALYLYSYRLVGSVDEVSEMEDRGIVAYHT